MVRTSRRSQAYRRPLRRTDFIKKLALPPAGLLWLALLGLGFLAAGIERAALALLSASIGLLYLLAIPRVANTLLERFDRLPAFDAQKLDLEVPTALVVLDAGRRLGAREYESPEFGGDGLKPMTLERLAYAAWLSRRLHLPILVSGNGAGPLMSAYLEQIFGVGVRWVEPESHNTHENAAFSAKMLRSGGIERLILITHFWHMPRALAAFAHTGLDVVAAPMDMSHRLDSWERGLLSLVPSALAMRRSHLAIHEGLGLFWYRWRYGHPRA